MMELVSLYLAAKRYLLSSKYASEVRNIDGLRFEDQDEESFYMQYLWTILSTNIKNQVAERMMHNYLHSADPLSTVKHLGKNKAISELRQHWIAWFQALRVSEDKLAYLGTLPYLGKINRYLLARNLGLDVAKPDRHMVRLAEKYGFTDVQEMCQTINKATGDRVGTIDVILWRVSNLGIIKQLSNKISNC